MISWSQVQPNQLTVKDVFDSSHIRLHLPWFHIECFLGGGGGGTRKGGLSLILIAYV